MTNEERNKLEDIANEIYKRGYNDGLERGVEVGYKHGYEKCQKKDSAQIPIVTIEGKKYCRFDDVQKLWEQMKGETE